QVPQVRPTDALDDVKHLRMRENSQPAPIVEPDRVLYQRVAFPMTHRVPHPAWIEIPRMRAPIKEDLDDAGDISFPQNRDHLRRLNDFVNERCYQQGVAREAEIRRIPDAGSR